MGIALCGYGESGKDTVAKWLAANTTLRYQKSTSQAAAEIVFERWGYSRYPDPLTCWLDRRNHRPVWQTIILNVNRTDPNNLGIYRILQADHDIYNGIRTPQDLEALYSEGLISLSVWVWRGEVEGDPIVLRPKDCDITLDNSGTIDQLTLKLKRWAQILNIYQSEDS